jgi:hypothetical protein
MFKTLTRFTSSFAALLSDQNTIIDADGRLENIRSAMFSAMLEFVDKEPYRAAKVWADISRAIDIQTLWYLRSDLLRILSIYCGEQSAGKQLDEITQMFRGVIPENQMPNRVDRRLNRRTV